MSSGLIVRLKGAPAHQRLLADPEHEGRREGARWQRVLNEAGLGATSGRREPSQRAVGRDQQLLGFGHLLGAAEAATLAARLRLRPDVDWVVPNVRERALQVPDNDPLYAQQWWLQPASGSDANAIAARLRGVPGFARAWTTGIPGATGSARAIVAVLDTGVTRHPDLDGHTLAGYDFVSEAIYANDGDGRDADASDPGDWVSAADQAAHAEFAGCEVATSSWHGTIIAGLVAAVTGNGIGVAGINAQGRVLPVRVAGKCGAAVADIIDGLRWAAGLAVVGAPANPNPARIISISFGGSGDCDAYAAAVAEVAAAPGGGAVVVAAAGNEHGAPTRPAKCAGVVGVVALNRDGFKTTYSNFGSVLTASGVATVGGDDSGDGLWADELADGGLVTVWNSGTQGPGSPDYAALFGTSFAAPLVAGAMSLMLSVNPALTVAQLVAGVRVSARPHVASTMIGACSDANPGRCICSTDTCGAGILDAEQALRYASDPAAYVAPVRSGQVIANAEVAQAAALGADRPSNLAPPAAAAPGAPGGGGATRVDGWLAALVLAVLALRRAGGGGASRALRGARRRA